jgi:hypothetical protein
MMDIGQAARENKLAELEILRQSLEERDARIWELAKKIEILEGMLNRWGSLRSAFPQPQPAQFASVKPAPRRWSVK